MQTIKLITSKILPKNSHFPVIRAVAPPEKTMKGGGENDVTYHDVILPVA